MFDFIDGSDGLGNLVAHGALEAFAHTIDLHLQRPRAHVELRSLFGVDIPASVPDIERFNVPIAGTVIAALPIVIVLIVFQRQLVRGLTDAPVDELTYFSFFPEQVTFGSALYEKATPQRPAAEPTAVPDVYYSNCTEARAAGAAGDAAAGHDVGVASDRNASLLSSRRIHLPRKGLGRLEHETQPNCFWRNGKWEAILRVASIFRGTATANEVT